MTMKSPVLEALKKLKQPQQMLSDIFKRLLPQPRTWIPDLNKIWIPDLGKLGWIGDVQLSERVDETSRQPAMTVAEKLAPMSPMERFARKEQEYRRVAQRLLERCGRGKYTTTKLTNLVVEMVHRAEIRMLAPSFAEEKRALRRIVETQGKQQRSEGKKKNEGQLPSPVTLNKVINSLEPIYQELRRAMSS
jgi:hypothetical protein